MSYYRPSATPRTISEEDARRAREVGDLMFGSQVLEVGVGLALLFFVVSTLASAVVELISRLLAKRAKDLKRTIARTLSDAGQQDVIRNTNGQTILDLFEGTVIYRSAKTASGRFGPAYLSARSFATAVEELLVSASPAQITILNRRLPVTVPDDKALSPEARATIENWFDEMMGRLSGAYKRWAAWVLFVVGLLLASLGNVSAPHAAESLWQQPAVRQAALDAAGQVAANGGQSADVGKNVTSIKDLTELGLPFGWDGVASVGLEWIVLHAIGWLITAFLVMLGGPFWFDVLSKLVSLRATGPKPPLAADDRAAASSIPAAAVPTYQRPPAPLAISVVDERAGAAERSRTEPGRTVESSRGATPPVKTDPVQRWLDDLAELWRGHA